jgi:hypothetical protein
MATKPEQQKPRGTPAASGTNGNPAAAAGEGKVAAPAAATDGTSAGAPVAGVAPASAAAAGASGGTQQVSATLRYVDRPGCVETFADSITSLSYDGQTLRIEFGVTALDEMKANEPVTGRRYPAARLVLTPSAAVELINRTRQIATALTQAGLLKATPTTPGKA